MVARIPVAMLWWWSLGSNFDDGNQALKMMEKEKGTWIPDDGPIITAPDYFFLGFLLLLSVVLLFAVELNPIWQENKAGAKFTLSGQFMALTPPGSSLHPPWCAGVLLVTPGFHHTVTSCQEAQIQDPSMGYQHILPALSTSIGQRKNFHFHVLTPTIIRYSLFSGWVKPMPGLRKFHFLVNHGKETAMIWSWLSENVGPWFTA